MRGLKSFVQCAHIDTHVVALLVSAWIEIDEEINVGALMEGRTPCECVD